MLLGLRSLWESGGAVIETETRGGVSPHGIRRPRYITWDDNVQLPSRIEQELARLKKQIAEEDELIAAFMALL